MADEATDTTETGGAREAATKLTEQATNPPEQKPDPPAANLIGEAQRKEDLEKALTAAKAAQKEAEKLRGQLEQIEAAKLSDLEKAQKQAEKAEARATEAEQKAVTLERGGWATAAAQRAQFADPQDAVAFLDLTELDSEDKVKEAVAELATTKPHLVGKEQGPTAFGSLSETPVGPDGKPDLKAGLGRELMGALTNRGR